MAQEDMQQFMMSFIMGTKPNEAAKLREGQLSPIQRRALTLRLQQAAGLSELGMTRRQQIAGKIDNMLMLKNVLTSEQQQSVQAVTAVKQAMKLVSTLTSNAAAGLGEGELTKYNKINQAGKLYQNVLLQQPVALQLLKIVGFREKAGEEGFLVLSHRNIAVLTLVRDKADNFVKNVKLPVAATDDDVDTVNAETAAKTAAVHDEQQQQQHDVDSKQHSSSHIALMIDLSSDTSITIKDLSVDDTLDSVLKQINASSEVNSSDNDADNTVIALAARFPKGVFDSATEGSKTLGELGIKTSTRLKAITAASSKQQHHTSKSHKATTDSSDSTSATTTATVRKAPAVTVTVSTPKKKAGTLFGKDGIIKAKQGPIEHIGGGGTTVTLATADTAADDDDAATSSSSAPLKTQRKIKRKKSKKSSSHSSIRHSSNNDKSAAEDV
jgi:PUB domain